MFVISVNHIKFSAILGVYFESFVLSVRSCIFIFITLFQSF